MKMSFSRYLSLASKNRVRNLPKGFIYVPQIFAWLCELQPPEQFSKNENEIFDYNIEYNIDI